MVRMKQFTLFLSCSIDGTDGMPMGAAANSTLNMSHMDSSSGSGLNQVENPWAFLLFTCFQ